MADLIGPFDTAPWSQTEWLNFAPTWAPSGIIGTPAASVSTGDFGVTAAGLTLTVAANGKRAWIDGSGYKPDTNKAITVTPNTNVSLSRRDRLVIRRDAAAKTTAIVRLEGTPAATPTAPALTQNTGAVFDVPICTFLVPPNSGTSITGFVDDRVWIDPAGGGPIMRGIELAATTAGLVVPPNTSSQTAFTATNVVGLDRDGFLQAGSGDQIKIPAGLGGVYTITWGGNLTATPPGRHFWDLLITGSRTAARRAAAYGDTYTSSATELRLAAGDIVKFEIYVDGTGPSGGNWPIAYRFLTCYRKSA